MNQTLTLKHILLLLPILLGSLGITEYSINNLQTNRFKEAVEIIVAPIKTDVANTKMDFQEHERVSARKFEAVTEATVEIEHLKRITQDLITEQHELVRQMERTITKLETKNEF